MNKDGDRVLTAIEHYVDQIQYEIEKAHRNKIHLNYDERWNLQRELNKLADLLSDYDEDGSLYKEEENVE
ncbi:MAG: hypothetical protein V3U54_07585 [Thermodesulfobacteriota bacterium]